MQKTVISVSLYTVVCNLVIYTLTREYEQKQPIGLIMVGMVFIPIIITIFGGLPLDCMNRERSVLTTNTEHDPK
jgi:pyrrolidone-carboxylate peptidase